MEANAGRARVVAVVGDLFFRSKILETAKQTGVPVAFVTTLESLREELRAGEVALVIVDLGAASLDPIAAVSAARSAAGVRTVAYVSHVDEGARRKAAEAGCDSVLAKSAFTRDLPRILLQGAKP